MNAGRRLPPARRRAAPATRSATAGESRRSGALSARAAAPGLPLAPLRALAAEAPLLLRVTGGSMAPAIPAGAAVTVRPAARCLPGDVVAFRGRDGRLRVHRALAWLPSRGGARLLARGDAAAGRDPAVPAADLLGRVETVDGAPLRVRPADRLRAVGALAAALLRSSTRRLGRA